MALKIRKNLRQSRNRLKSKNIEPSSPERAYLHALRLLTARDYTEARLREKLHTRNYDDADCDVALVRLTSEGWVDDRRFAERFTESALASSRYYGPRLRQEMLRRGIPADMVSEVLGRVLADHDEAEDINSILARRFGAFSFSTASDKEKRRVMGFLQRRGYTLSTIMRAMRTAVDE
jgi:regulatory protein